MLNATLTYSNFKKIFIGTKQLYFSIVILALLIPIFSVKYFPLIDLPNHLARAYIISSYNDIQEFKNTFQIVIAPLPNLSFDIIVLFIMQFFNAIDSAKIFIIITIMLFAVGCIRLSLYQDEENYLSIVSSFFIYSSGLFWGFVNYVFGIAIYFVALSYWLQVKDRPTPLSISIFGIFCMLCYLSHLTSFFILCISVGFLSIYDLISNRNAFKSHVFYIIGIIPPLTLFYVYMSGSGKVGTIVWNNIYGKLEILLSIFISYNYMFDLFFIFGLIIGTIFIYKNSDSIKINRPLFYLGLLLLFICLLSPQALLTADSVDARFVLPASVLITSAIRIKLSNSKEVIVTTCFFMLFIIRIGFVTNSWLSFEKNIIQQHNSYQKIQKFSKIYPIIGGSVGREKSKNISVYNHIIHYATIERNSIVPTLFTFEGQQPIRFRQNPGYLSLHNIAKEQWDDITKLYDYIWCYNISVETKEILRGISMPLEINDLFSLWKIYK